MNDAPDTIGNWLRGAGTRNSRRRYDLMDRAMRPTSAERDPLVLPDPRSKDAKAILTLLRNGQVPTPLAIAGNPAAMPAPPPRAWPDDDVDRFGKHVAQLAHDQWALHEYGPTWAELLETGATLELLRDEYGIDGAISHKHPDLNALMRAVRRRGWIASNNRTRSSCAGPSFFAGSHRDPWRTGRRVADAVRQYRLDHHGARPTLDDIAQVRDAAGGSIFRSTADARAQTLWLATEDWVHVKRETDIVVLGDRSRYKPRRRSETKSRSDG